MEEENILRLVLLGKDGVGKSSLFFQWMSHRFVEEYDPTLEDSSRKQIKVDNEQTLLEVLDSTESPEYQHVRNGHLKIADVGVILYSIIDQSSLVAAEAFAERLCQLKSWPEYDGCLVFAGSKADLEDQRTVTPESVEHVLRRFQAPHFLFSAKQATDGLNPLLIDIVRRYLTYAKAHGLPMKGTRSRVKMQGHCALQ